MATLHQLTDRYSIDEDGFGVYGTNWEDLTPLIEEQIHSFNFQTDRLDDSQNTPLHKLAAEQPPLHVVKMLITADPAQATIRDEDGCLPLEVACSYGANLEVITYIAEQYPAALAERNESYKSKSHSFSSSPTSTMMTSFFSPIPFSEIRNIITHRPFPALGPNMRRYLSAQKRMETMVQVRLLIKWEESTLSPSELDLIYTHPILRGEALESNPPLRFAYAVLAHGVTGQFLVADTIFSFISAAG